MSANQVRMCRLRSMSPAQIEDREKEHPDNVDEVPVQADIFCGDPTGCPATAQMQARSREECDAHKDMQRVKSSRDEVPEVTSTSLPCVSNPRYETSTW